MRGGVQGGRGVRPTLPQLDPCAADACFSEGSYAGRRGMGKAVDQWLARLRDAWQHRGGSSGSAVVGAALLGVLVVGALLSAGVFAARALSSGSPTPAPYASQSGTAEVFTIPAGTETIVRDGKTVRVVRAKPGETVVRTRRGRTLTLQGQTVKETATQTIRSTNTKTETVTEMQTVTVTEPVTVTVEVTTTEDKGKP